MPEFLELLPPQQAWEVFRRALPPESLPGERVPTVQARGRVTAVPVTAGENLPAFSRSTVDGYAVQARDTFGASESLPAYLKCTGEVPMGAAPAFSIGRGECALIHTGGMLPDGADAVVMLEHTQTSRPGEVEILRAVPEGENVLLAGEDVRAGEVVLPAGMRLEDAQIGGLMALGILEVDVVRQPRVGILSSGDEVIPPEQSPLSGQVRDVNSYSLSALVERHGGLAHRYGIVPDRPDALREFLRRALDECDAVIITAGSSASTRDFTASVINEMGAPGVLVHGVNVKPGKPTILGVCEGKPVIGLPGNPVSALVIARLFVVPVLHHLLGYSGGRWQPAVRAILTVNLASQAGREDYVPVQLIQKDGRVFAEPVFYKSNLIFTLARADGLVKIPSSATGLGVGEEVEVQLL
ncbi:MULTISPECIES: gephyrin-like molybdotransferase Glp [Anaerolinea]|uniref:molybdopterin-binding protein n=1 Tax=Anaerolinea TaxID=233189 RepID=UPI00261C6E7F|nr:gephyrin-like molybdotransferase Glp [Anaerolinea thermophila]